VAAVIEAAFDETDDVLDETDLRAGAAHQVLAGPSGVWRGPTLRDHSGEWMA
jgi:hypothetical protein